MWIVDLVHPAKSTCGAYMLFSLSPLLLPSSGLSPFYMSFLFSPSALPPDLSCLGPLIPPLHYGHGK